jgi:exopolyphosphatase / guanosine-5'-triphosphate,3'-diphosphate pyrophosphatase
VIPIDPRLDTFFNEYAVIDLGSNTFHMIVAREVNHSLQIIYELKKTVRLADGLSAQKKLSKQSITRAMKCLALFSERIKHLPKKNIRIVATHALRIAKNSHHFLRAASKILPYPIEIISGKEEARLIYLGVAHSLLKKETKLVIDIGGGSTEIAVGSGLNTLLVDSQPMGCVSYMEQFFPNLEMNQIRFENAKNNAIQLLEKISPHINSISFNYTIGTSSTIKAIRNLLVEMGMADGIITYERLDLLYQYFLSCKTVSGIKSKAISDSRKSVIFAGLAILMALFETLGIDQLHYCTHALRNGVLYELMNHLNISDIRQHTAFALSTQYHIDRIHAQKVMDMSKHFYQQWQQQTENKLNRSLESLLYWAALLHEIGLNINYSSIHKHSAYILRNSNLPGFNQEQQLLLATLVRNHRKSLKPENIPNFTLFEHQHVMILIKILRLAILINKQRQGDLPLNAFHITTSKHHPQQIELVIDAQVAQRNQLILLDLKQEQIYWQQYQHWQLNFKVVTDILAISK